MQRSALCRSRRELSNAYFLAKLGFDTAENEPCQVCPIPRNAAADDRAGLREEADRRQRGRDGRLLVAVRRGRLLDPQGVLQGVLMAVWKRW